MLRASEAAINWGQTRLESGGPRSVGVGRSLPPYICAVQSVEPKDLSASVQRLCFPQRASSAHREAHWGHSDVFVMDTLQDTGAPG